MLVTLVLGEGGRIIESFPLDEREDLKSRSQVVCSLAGYRIEVSAWDPMLCLKTFAPRAPKPTRFRMIGTKPGSEVVEELAVFGMNGKVSLPAGTRILKVERITEE